MMPTETGSSGPSVGQLKGGAAQGNKPTPGPLRAAAVLQRTTTWLFPFWDGPSALPLPAAAQALHKPPARSPPEAAGQRRA